VPGASVFPFFNQLYQGDLCDRLREWHDVEGLSLEAMCDRIASEKGQRPSSSSLSRWLAGEECG
jgi:hypothetical protein